MYQNPNNQTQNPGILPGLNVAVLYLETIPMSNQGIIFACLFYFTVLSPEDEQKHFDTFFEVN